MYTRNYQLKREPSPAQSDEAREELPSIIEEQCKEASIEPVTAEIAPSGENIPSPEKKKRRFRAARVPILRAPEPIPVCEAEPSAPECPQKKQRLSERGGFFRDLSSDEMLVIALIVLLLCEGGDDILILALCFVLA